MTDEEFMKEGIIQLLEDVVEKARRDKAHTVLIMMANEDGSTTTAGGGNPRDMLTLLPLGTCSIVNKISSRL